MSQKTYPRALDFKHILNISILTVTFKLRGLTYLFEIFVKQDPNLTI